MMARQHENTWSGPKADAFLQSDLTKDPKLISLPFASSIHSLGFLAISCPHRRTGLQGAGMAPQDWEHERFKFRYTVAGCNGEGGFTLMFLSTHCVKQKAKTVP